MFVNVTVDAVLLACKAKNPMSQMFFGLLVISPNERKYWVILQKNILRSYLSSF
jgi:hypothetical protein